MTAIKVEQLMAWGRCRSGNGWTSHHLVEADLGQDSPDHSGCFRPCFLALSDVLFQLESPIIQARALMENSFSCPKFSHLALCPLPATCPLNIAMETQLYSSFLNQIDPPKIKTPIIRGVVSQRKMFWEILPP